MWGYNETTPWPWVMFGGKDGPATTGQDPPPDRERKIGRPRRDRAEIRRRRRASRR